MIIKKLSYMPYAQAHVEIDDDGNIYLFSYTTLVIELTVDNWLTCTGTYSQTTRKHIDAFMEEYVKYPNDSYGTYTDVKHAFENNYRINIETGEIEDL